MQKLKYNYIKNAIESEGYILLTKETEYKNTSDGYLKIKCSKNHITNISWNNWKRGSRCNLCSKRRRLTIDFIEKEFKKEGYILLSKKYINNSTKLKYKCPLGHLSSISWINWKKGSRCGECFGSKKYSKDEIKSILSEYGYMLISDYKNALSKIEVKCPKGHIYKTKINRFKYGNRCPKCSNRCPEQTKENFLKLIKQEGYALLSEYKNTTIKVKIQCPEGHEWNVMPSSFIHNNIRCPHCAGSTGQRKLQSLLEENTGHKMIYNDRMVLNGLELDIYFPELKIAIEYQGDYWHSRPETIERDKRKKELCKELGIKLIEIWDSDFRNNTKNKVTDIINIIYGRTYEYKK